MALVGVRMYFISDLDKTLVYSRQSECTCVEYKNDKPITYMAPKAKEIMDGLLQKETFHFIPCTLRSIEQTLRIGFIKDLTTQKDAQNFIICDNGASIYKNGVVDEEWDAIIAKIINKDNVAILCNRLQQYVEENNIPIYMIKTNRNAFVSIIFNTNDMAEKYLDSLLKLVDKSCYNIFKQGKKTYVVPIGLNKEIAVKYLREHYGIHDVITSGDSSVDDKFVELGDYQVLPKHAVFRTTKARVTDSEGVVGGEELLEIVKELAERKIC